MNYTLLIIALIILLLSISLKMEFDLDFNLLTNTGQIKLKLYKITIFNVYITLIDDYLNLTARKEKEIKIKIDFKDDSFIFFQKLGKRILKKIYSTKLKVDVNLCIENAFLASTVGTTVNIILSILIFNFTQTHNDLNVVKNVNIGFRHNIIELFAVYNFSITLFDFIWSIYKTFIGVRKGNEKEKTQSRVQYNNR